MAGYGSVDPLNDDASLEGDAVPGTGGADGSLFYGEGAGGGVARSARRWGWRRVLSAFLGLVLLAAIVAWFIELPYYALTPGAAPAVSGLITVPAAHRHVHRGSVLLVYVELTQLRALYYPFFWLDSDATIYPADEILGSETAAQYATEGQIDMSTAQQAATVVALRQLGYQVSVVPIGALVYGILPGSPAASVLRVGEVISRVNNTRIATYLGPDGLSTVLENLAPYSTVHVVVSTYPAGRPHTVSFNLGVFRTTPSGYECLPRGVGTKYRITEFDHSAGGKPRPLACMGIYPQGSGGAAVDGTAFRIGALPVKVDLSSEGIVGPSAGLAFTLGLMQELDPADLTGGRKVAATGTMSIDGSVGDVGGVAQKTIAVRNAGASIFFVPPQEYSVAKAHAGSQLHVFAVSSIAQAVHILESFGGRIARTAA